MTKYRYTPFAFLALVACQMPNHEPAVPTMNELARELLETRLQAVQPDVYREPSAAAAIDELNARVATLNDRLDVLTKRLAGWQPDATVARDASAAAAEPDGSHVSADHELAAITALRSSLDVLMQQERLCCQNIANVNVAGYKKRDMVTSNVLDEKSGLLVPQPGAVTAVFTTGTLEITERALDIAIDGDGFFSVVLFDGSVGYTRAGHMHIDADGRLVTTGGYVVSPQITVPNDTLEISFDPKGLVSGRTGRSPDTATHFGQLITHRFVNPGELRAVGSNLYRVTEGSGQPITGNPGSNGLGVLKQGFVERSNVQLHNELINLQVIRRQQAALRRSLADYGVFVR